MELKRGSAKSFFLDILNSKLVIVILFFTIFSLAIVLAGDIIVKEGTLDVENNLTVSNILYVKTLNNSVGIGRVNPRTILDIVGSNPSITIGNNVSNAGQTSIIFSHVNGATQQKTAIISNYTAGWGRSNLYFALDSAADTENVEISDAKMTILNGGNVGIGTTTPSYPLTVYGNGSGNLSAWFQNNISATGFITRTSVYSEKENKKANDWIQNSDYYLNDGKIDHTKFYGYTNWDENIFDDNENLISSQKIEGISLDEEINVLRQALYETQCELCSYDSKYSWCGKCD